MMIKNNFHKKGFCTCPRFKKEACSISEMACCVNDHRTRADRKKLYDCVYKRERIRGDSRAHTFLNF